MIIADKIIQLRKKNGWSQEELADKMNVSRQAVSKWEGAQTIPDLSKILQMSELFGVTTDYLLKDEIENEEFTNNASDFPVRRVSLEFANTYIDERKRSAWQIALATLLCILSPITLIILGAASEIPSTGVSETLMGIIGLSVLFALILCAVPIFIYCGFKNEPYAFLDEGEGFELEYGVRGIVNERKKQFRSTYVRWNIIATCLCIFSPIPLIVSAFSENEFLSVIMLALMMIIVAFGVSIFIVVGVRNGSMQKLLKEGEYAEKEKKRRGLRESVGFAYWGVVTAIYLGWSFISNDWHISWLTFAIGGILFPVAMSICNIMADKKR